VSKGDPVPTRFDAQEEAAIEALHRRTGLSRAEIIRRGVRLLRLRYEREGSAAFIVEELAPPYGGASRTGGAPRTTDESPAGFRVKKKSQK
jgi:hypothetical protein